MPKMYFANISANTKLSTKVKNQGAKRGDIRGEKVKCEAIEQGDVEI